MKTVTNIQRVAITLSLLMSFSRWASIVEPSTWRLKVTFTHKIHYFFLVKMHFTFWTIIHTWLSVFKNADRHLWYSDAKFSETLLTRKTSLYVAVQLSKIIIWDRHRLHLHRQIPNDMGEKRSWAFVLCHFLSSTLTISTGSTSNLDFPTLTSGYGGCRLFILMWIGWLFYLIIHFKILTLPPSNSCKSIFASLNKLPTQNERNW